MTPFPTCFNCGLENVQAPTCPRCGVSLTGGAWQGAPPPPNVGYPPQMPYQVPGGYPPQVPYQSPGVPVYGIPQPMIGIQGMGIWRTTDDKLVMHKFSGLPHACVKCNQPAAQKLRRKFSWHNPIWALLILVGLLFYLIAVLIVRKQATIDVGLCQEHIDRRRNMLIAGFGVLALGFVTMFSGFAFPDYGGAGFLLGIVMLIAAAIWVSAVARILPVAKMDDTYVWFKGVNRDFLAQFPTWPGV